MAHEKKNFLAPRLFPLMRSPATVTVYCTSLLPPASKIVRGDYRPGRQRSRKISPSPSGSTMILRDFSFAVQSKDDHLRVLSCESVLCNGESYGAFIIIEQTKRKKNGSQQSAPVFASRTNMKSDTLLRVFAHPQCSRATRF